MRKNFGPKPYILPQPVFIIATYGADGVPDAMTSVWGGISNEHEITICIASQRQTLKNILDRGAFTVSMADASVVAACDYVGLESAKRVPDKFEKAGFHAIPAATVDAPLIAELPFALECRLKNYDAERWCMIGEIVNVCAEESILDENGLVALERFKPLVFDWMHKDYRLIGGKAGKAFHDGLPIKKAGAGE